MDGIYRYDPKLEKPVLHKEGNYLCSMREISLEQDFMTLSNIAFIMVYNSRKIAGSYGRDSRKFAILECGHIAQNILLIDTALDLGSVPVGAFYPGRLGKIMDIPKQREALYMICVGIIGDD